MSQDTLSTVRELLVTVLDETDDAEVHYKLRTAMQLLDIHCRDLTRLDDLAEDDELRSRLEDLGYLD